MLDPAVQTLLNELRARRQFPPAGHEGPVAGRRWAVRHRTPWLAGDKDARVIRTEVQLTAGRIPGRLYSATADGERSHGLVVFAHGGGWVTGDLETHDALCAELSRLSEWSVLAVDYRRAPEHPFPAALDDVSAVVNSMLADGIDGWTGRSLVVAGDSAGGNLAAVIAQRLRREEALRGQILIYPILDTSTERDSYRKFGSGYTLDTTEMAWFWDQYVPDPRSRDRADLVPLAAADLADCPPCLILSASHDVLRDEGAAYSERLNAAGVPAELVVSPGTVHGFMRMTQVVPAACQALVRAASWLKGL